MKRPRTTVWTAAVVFLLLLAGGCAHTTASDARSAGQAAPVTAAATATAPIQHDYGRLPVHFEENRGQAGSDVRFIARTATGRVLLAPDGLVLGAKGTPVRLSFAGGSSAPAMEALEPLPGRVNYYSGDDPKNWRIDVPTYGRVRYAAVYPGIDVVVYGNQRQLEYDFLIAPGADPARIRLAVSGISALAVDGAGDLHLVTAHGTLVQRKPVIYQEVDGLRVPIDGGYVVGDRGEVGFRVAAYDATRPLVIDPVIAYSTYLGSGGTDVIWGVAVDGSGNAYVAGHTNNFDAIAGSDTFPWKDGISPPAGFNGTAGFVAKLDPSGSSLVFASYTECQARAIALDGAGNVYVGGVTSSKTFATTAGSFQATAPGAGENGCVLKLNPAGNAITWATYIGGPGSASQSVKALAVDSSGAVYVAGSTGSTSFPVTPGAPQATFGGGTSDGFVAKLAPTGATLMYSSYLGGSGTDGVTGLAVDTSNQVYVTGQATAGFPTTGGVLKPAIGASDPSDAFVTKLAANGSLVYSTFVGGSNGDTANALDIDAAGNAYVTGHTFSSDFPLVNAYSTTPAGDWVFKLNTTGSALVYSTYLPETSNAVGIAVDSSGAAYIAGATGSETFPQVNPIMTDKICDPLNDCVYVTKLNPSGQLTAAEYSVILGMGSGGAFAHGMAADAAGNVYVVGRTGSGYTTTSGAFDTTHAAQDEFDGFVTKLSNASGGGDGGGGDTIAPTVSITSPSGNVWTGNSIGFSVTASDNVGLVSIKLWGNGAVFATINCSGTTCSGNTGWLTGPLPQAAYQVHAVALDTAGNQTLSAPVTIFKDATSPLVPSGASATGGGGTTPPAALGAAITSPANGATVSGASVGVTMTASNAQGTPISFVLKVDSGATIFSGSGSAATVTTTWNTTGLTNGAHTLNLTVTDSAGRTASAAVSVTVSNTNSGGGAGGTDTVAPTVSITSPSGNVWTGNSLGFSVAASDNAGLVSVKLWGNGGVFATVTCAGTTCSGNTGWLTGPLPPAAYQVHAVALDTAGNQTLSAPVTIFKDATSPLVPSGASGGTAPPPPPASTLGAAITSPVNGATVSGTSVGVTMTATNAQGSPTSFVLKVDNGATIFSQSVAGSTASATWNTTGLTNGTHTLNLTVTDGAGRTASATVSVTVSNVTGGGGGDTTAPAVTITSPSNGAWTGNSIGVKASASDNIGVAMLTFYGNGSQFGQVKCTGTPTCLGEYWWLTGPLPSGKHTISVVATDTAGNTKTSAPVVINK